MFTDADGAAYPDTVVGTDSHTPMVNGLGVLAWGVGGIEAEAAMLGQPISMLVPPVVGLRLTGELPEGHDRHRPRAHGRRAAAAPRRRRQVRRVLRPGRGEGAAREPGDHRQHVAGVRLDRDDLPDRRRDAPLPAAHGPSRGALRARRGLRQGAGPVARRDGRAQPIPSGSSSTCRPSSRASPAPRARRTACRCAAPRRCSPRPCRARCPTACPVGPGRHGDRPRADVRLADGTRVRPRARPRRDRRHHELHEHLEPAGDDRRRPRREEGRRARARPPSPG